MFTCAGCNTAFVAAERSSAGVARNQATNERMYVCGQQCFLAVQLMGPKRAAGDEQPPVAPVPVLTTAESARLAAAERVRVAQAAYDTLKARLANGNVDVEVRDSTIAGAGSGLFARRAFRRGEPITRYDGFVLSHGTAMQMSVEEQSHFRVLLPLSFIVDGNRTARGEPVLEPAFELDHLGMGAMANDARPPNAEYDYLDSPVNEAIFAANMPANRLKPTERFIFLRATEDIPAGAEVFASSGRRAT